MALSYTTYAGNGVTATFSVTFGYLSKSHISVTVNGVAASFTWPTDSTVTISPTPGNGTAIVIRRNTPTSALTDFTDGSGTFEAQLDTLSLQTAYVTEEIRDLVNDLSFGGASPVASGIAVAPTVAGGSTVQAALEGLEDTRIPINSPWTGASYAEVNVIAYSFNGDSNTGMLSSGADTLALSAGGNWNVVVSASGGTLTGGWVLNGSLTLSGVTNQIILNERDGVGAFSAYADANNFRVYSQVSAADVFAVNHSGVVQATQYLENGNRVHSKTSRSSSALTPQAYVGQARYDFAHGFGAVPSNWQIFARCLTADAGYSVGDVVCIEGASGTGSCNSSADATNVYVSVAGQINVSSKSGAAFVNLNASGTHWELFVHAWP